MSEEEKKNILNKHKDEIKKTNEKKEDLKKGLKTPENKKETT
jgi:hypothetical protein